jgi:hypothetical protein
MRQVESEIEALRKQIRVLEYRSEYGLYSLDRRESLARAAELRAKLTALESRDVDE